MNYRSTDHRLAEAVRYSYDRLRHMNVLRPVVLYMLKEGVREVFQDHQHITDHVRPVTAYIVELLQQTHLRSWMTGPLANPYWGWWRLEVLHEVKCGLERQAYDKLIEALKKPVDLNKPGARLPYGADAYLTEPTTPQELWEIRYTA